MKDFVYLTIYTWMVITEQNTTVFRNYAVNVQVVVSHISTMCEHTQHISVHILTISIDNNASPSLILLIGKYNVTY